MINQLEENLDDFVPTEMWKSEFFNWFSDFINKEGNTKLYSWIDITEQSINFSNSNPPRYYEDTKNRADFQIVYFLKYDIGEPVTINNINDRILVGQVDGDPLDDMLNKMKNSYLSKLLKE